VLDYLPPIEIDELGEPFWSQLELFVHQELAREADGALLVPFVGQISMIWQNSLQRVVELWRQNRTHSDASSGTMDIALPRIREPTPCHGVSLLADVEGPARQDAALTPYNPWDEGFGVQQDGESQLESLIDTGLPPESSYLTPVTSENFVAGGQQLLHYLGEP
jgi:hypothetical protein